MKRALLISAGCVLLAGCGGAAHNSTTSTTTPKSTVATTPDATTQLEAAVRRAIDEEHNLSVEVLSTNRLPANPAAIGGPALTVLRHSVAERQGARVRVRVLSERFRIVGIHLDPSYTDATAVVLENQRVQPTYLNGKPRERPSTAHERVRLELHRVGETDRFLVWKVTLL
jgi:hypothetical protein